MKEYFLFIDESGSPDLKNRQSDIYIFCGCSIPKYKREELKIWADRIKFKYWGKTNVVFHSREIGRNEGAFSYFLSPGFTELNIDFQKIRRVLTSLCFITKDNLDIEEQIADLFAYGAKCKFEEKSGRIKKGSYEEKIISILEKKLFKKPSQAKERKMKFYEKIESFCILPRETKKRA